MDRVSIKEFLRELHENPNVLIEDRGDWVGSTCPLSPWLHERGTDNHISFGIKVDDNSQSAFNCFSCHKAGPLTKLVDLVEEYSGRDLSTIRVSVDDTDYLSPYVPKWDGRKRMDNTIVNLEPADESVIEIYDSAVGHWYLAQRGILDETAAFLNLRVDPDNKGEERILFPVYDHHKRFFGFSGRSTHDDTELRVRDYFGLPKRQLLLGSHLINKDVDKYIILVEGLFDYAQVWNYGYSAVAALHSSLTLTQTNILIEIGLPVVCMFDNDQAGRNGQEIVKQSLARHIPLFKVRYPTGTTKIRSNRRGFGPKDPATLTQDQLDFMLAERRVL